MLKFYIIIGIALGIVFVIKQFSEKKQKPDLSVYKKKPFLFDELRNKFEEIFVNNPVQ